LGKTDGLVYDTSKFSNRPELFDYLQISKRTFSAIIDCCTVGEAGGCISPEDALKMADRENGSISMVFNFDTVWNNGNYGSIGKKRRGHQNRCPFAQEQLHALV
jgi:hypothetical protein